MTKYVFGILLICLTVAAYLLVRSSPSLDGEQKPQIELSGETEQDFEKTNQAVEAAFGDASRKLSFLSSDINSQTKLLIEAQDHWLKYRNNHCEILGTKFDGGSMKNMVVNECKTQLNRQRVEQLQVLTQGE